MNIVQGRDIITFCEGRQGLTTCYVVFKLLDIFDDSLYCEHVDAGDFMIVDKYPVSNGFENLKLYDTYACLVAIGTDYQTLHGDGLHRCYIQSPRIYHVNNHIWIDLEKIT